MTPASRTEPIVGASVWASGSHVWNGHIGTFTANPRNTAAKITSWIDLANGAVAATCCSVTMSNVCGFAWKNIPMKPNSMNTLPVSVYRKNLMDAYCRLPEPQIPIRKYMGIRTNSQNTKKRIRSNAMNVPAMPVMSKSVNATNALIRPGSGTY